MFCYVLLIKPSMRMDGLKRLIRINDLINKGGFVYDRERTNTEGFSLV